MLHVRPQHIHRCLACLILATMLMMMPALADSSSLEDDLTSLSDADLLLLKQLVDAEVESRGLLISAQDGQTSDDPLVWIPRSGSKYHSKSTCSNMKNPIQVTLRKQRKAAMIPVKSAIRRHKSMDCRCPHSTTSKGGGTP